VTLENESQEQYAKLLSKDEKIQWVGRLGFGLSSHPATTVIVLVFSAYVFNSTWFSYSFSQFCNDPSVGKCPAFYWFFPPGIFLLALGFGFDWLERWRVQSGKATGYLVLTQRRLIRVIDWPWQRIRSNDYIEKAPKKGILGGIKFDNFHTLMLAPGDAETVLGLMYECRKIAR
jgi:hypothetical protein